MVIRVLGMSGLLDEFWSWLGDTELAFQIGATWWFPLLESIHVLCLVILVGAIMMADMRVLGRTATQYPLKETVGELTRIGWIAFVPAVITGLGLFISRPGAYADNPAFQIKVGCLLLLGCNVWFFHRRARRNEILGADVQPGLRASAGLSLALWAVVVFAGRWVGHIN